MPSFACLIFNSRKKVGFPIVGISNSLYIMVANSWQRDWLVDPKIISSHILEQLRYVY